MKHFNEYLSESENLESYIINEEIIEEGFWSWLGAILASGLALIGAGVAKLFKWMFSSTEENVRNNGGEYVVKEKTVETLTSGKDLDDKHLIVSAMTKDQTDKFLGIVKASSGGPFNDFYNFFKKYENKKNKQETTFFVNYDKETVALIFVTSEDEKNFYIEFVSTYDEMDISQNIFSTVKDKIVDILKNTYKTYTNLRIRFDEAKKYFTGITYNKELKCYTFSGDTGEESGEDVFKISKELVDDIIKNPNKYPIKVAPIDVTKLKNWCEYKTKEHKDSKKYYDSILEYRNNHEDLIPFAMGIQKVNEASGNKPFVPIGVLFIDDKDINEGGTVTVFDIFFSDEFSEVKIPQDLIMVHIFQGISNEMSVKIENIKLSDELVKKFNIEDAKQDKIEDFVIEEVDDEKYNEIVKNTDIEKFKKSKEDFDKIKNEKGDLKIVVIKSKKDDKDIIIIAFFEYDKNGEAKQTLYGNDDLTKRLTENAKDKINKELEKYLTKKESDDNKPLSDEEVEDILKNPENRPMIMVDIDSDSLKKLCEKLSADDKNAKAYYDSILKYHEEHKKYLIYDLQIAKINEASSEDKTRSIGIVFVNDEKLKEKNKVTIERIYPVLELNAKAPKLPNEILEKYIEPELKKNLKLDKDSKIELSKDVSGRFDIKEKDDKKDNEYIPEEIIKELEGNMKDLSISTSEIKSNEFEEIIKEIKEKSDYNIAEIVQYKKDHDKDDIFTIEVNKEDNKYKVGFIFIGEKINEADSEDLDIYFHQAFTIFDNELGKEFKKQVKESLESWAKESGFKIVYDSKDEDYEEKFNNPDEEQSEEENKDETKPEDVKKEIEQKSEETTKEIEDTQKEVEKSVEDKEKKEEIKELTNDQKEKIEKLKQEYNKKVEELEEKHEKDRKGHSMKEYDEILKKQEKELEDIKKEYDQKVKDIEDNKEESDKEQQEKDKAELDKLSDELNKKQEDLDKKNEDDDDYMDLMDEVENLEDNIDNKAKEYKKKYGEEYKIKKVEKQETKNDTKDNKKSAKEIEDNSKKLKETPKQDKKEEVKKEKENIDKDAEKTKKEIEDVKNLKESKSPYKNINKNLEDKLDISLALFVKKQEKFNKYYELWKDATVNNEDDKAKEYERKFNKVKNELDILKIELNKYKDSLKSFKSTNNVLEGLDVDNLEWKLDAWFNRDSHQRELFNRILNDPTTLEIALADGFDMQGLVNFTYDNVKPNEEIDYFYQLDQLMNFLKDK